MNAANKFLIGLPLILIGHVAVAQDYMCKIDRVVLGQSNKAKQEQILTQRYKGKEFSVNRRTGVMSGALKNSYLTEPEVIDSGSKENSFKVINSLRLEQGAGRGTNVYVLVIGEYQEGPAKPFTFVENDEVYFGSCRHF